MTRFFTNSTVDGLARVPGRTGKTKHVYRGRDRVADRHQNWTVSIQQVREVLEIAMTDGVNLAIGGEGGLDGFLR